MIKAFFIKTKNWEFGVQNALKNKYFILIFQCFSFLIAECEFEKKKISSQHPLKKFPSLSYGFTFKRFLEVNKVGIYVVYFSLLKVISRKISEPGSEIEALRASKQARDPDRRTTFFPSPNSQQQVTQCSS